MVRQRSAKPLFVGSIPAPASPRAAASVAHLLLDKKGAHFDFRPARFAKRVRFRGQVAALHDQGNQPDVAEWVFE